MVLLTEAIHGRMEMLQAIHGGGEKTAAGPTPKRDETVEERRARVRREIAAAFGPVAKKRKRR